MGEPPGSPWGGSDLTQSGARYADWPERGGATYALAAIRPAQDAEVVTLIISLVLRGAIQMWRGSETRTLHAFPGDGAWAPVE